MKKVQIKGNKVFIFEEKELREKLRMKEEDIQLVLEYQRVFPELLQEYQEEEFIINARELWKNLNKPQGNFADFAKRDIVDSVFKEKGKNTKEKKYKENIDFIRNRNFAKGDKNGYGNKTTIEYKLTVHCAKKIALQQGNKIGDTIQNYFILMEKTLRNYEEWNISRDNEKNGWNEMELHIKEWCERKGFDSSIRLFYIREANMINQSLLGYNASEINYYLNNNDKITRNHLDKEINDALAFLQQLNSSLLFSDMDLEDREKIIKTTCINKYSELKEKFNRIIKVN